jgi:hypothetical protein
MELAFLWSPRLAGRCNFRHLVSHYVVNRQFNDLGLLRLMLTAPIGVMLVLYLWAKTTNAHDLLILEESAVSTIRM